MTATPPPLDVAHVQHLLRDHRIGRHMRHELECASTNDLARTMLAEGIPSGSVVVAEAQTRGRGRFQRPWTSDPGLNLLFTVIVRWPRTGFAAPWLTLAAALAIRAAAQELYRLPARLKWPNDVVLTLGDGVQKLAGVLTEATSLGPAEMGAVVGVGLNVNQVWPPSTQDPLRPRVSLAAALGRPIDREPLLASCLAAFEERFDLLSGEGAAPLIAEARQHLVGLGRAIRIESPGRAWSGVIAGITDDYHLLLETPAGTQDINVGEVLFGGGGGAPV